MSRRQKVSIHATLAGGDRATNFSIAIIILFLSTPPSRVATFALPTKGTRLNCFYPRHPRGWRLSKSILLPPQIVMFLSTPPSRVATLTMAISIRQHLRFLSTPPSRVATDNCRNLLIENGVSIHATLAGGDDTIILPHQPQKVFLSTPPSRVATAVAGGVITMLISFYPRHPRGWRRIGVANVETCLKFLSTPPSRVATKPPYISSLPSVRFYPRHPRGWRRSIPLSALPCHPFLSTPPSRVATF